MFGNVSTTGYYNHIVVPPPPNFSYISRYTHTL